MVGDDDDAPWDKGFGSVRPDGYRTEGGSKRPTGLTNPGGGSPYATNPGRSVDVGQTNPGASVEISLDIGRKSSPGRSRPTARPEALTRSSTMPMGRPDPRRTSEDLGATQPGIYPSSDLGATQSGGGYLSGDPGTSLGGPPPGTMQEDERKRRALLAKKAKEFLVHIDTLGRLLTIHDARNSAVQSALRDLVADVVALQQGGEDLKLVFAEGHAFVNGVWVRASKRAWEAAQLLTERLEGVEGRGLVLEPGTEAATLLALTDFLRTPPPEGVSGADHFKNAALPGIKLVPLPSQADRARAGQPQALGDAVQIFREGLETVTRSELANLDLYMRRRQRALVQNLIQLAENSPEELLTLTVMRDPTLGSRAHTLMVAIYSIALGRLMDLSRRDLLRLGMCALNHNVGESLLDEGLFAADRKLQSHERATIEQHPLLGMLHVLKHYGFGAAALERALTAAEHHMHHDAEGGYPFQADRPTHLFSRIIAVADVFDALCSQRPWRAGYPPDQAVKLVTRQGGRHLDPIVVRRLLWLVGRYPPGSMVELDTGEWALVVGPGRGAFPLVRPRVLLISDDDGWELATPVVVDLGERHPRRRAWLRTIARTRDPRKLGLEVAPYFFGDRIEADPGRLDSDEMGDQ